MLKPIQILVILSLFFAVGCKKDVPVTDVKFDKSNIILAAGTTETLTATVLPPEATDTSVSWTSSDEAVVTVANRIITANGAGVAIITVTTNDGSYKDTCIVTVTLDTLEWVEIGNVKWAKYNLDSIGTFAARLEDAGMFYQLEKDNDPCPPGWRVPTHKEQASLVHSGSKWTKLNGVNGRYFGTDDRRVFLPAAGYRDNATGALGNVGGYGYYWSNESSGSNNAYAMYFSIEGVGTNNYSRNFGFSVRCVKE